MEIAFVILLTIVLVFRKKIFQSFPDSVIKLVDEDEEKNNLNSNKIMDKHYLRTRYKSKGIAYLLWFFFGLHYAYMGKWGIQILFWIVSFFAWFFFLFWVWWIIDLFRISSIVNNHNILISRQIEEIEKKEKDDEFLRNMFFKNNIK